MYLVCYTDWIIMEITKLVKTGYPFYRQEIIYMLPIIQDQIPSRMK